MSSPAGWGAADRVLALLLFAAAAVYLSSLPRNLSAFDESYFLYEAKRIRDGEVMYRDIFQFVTPLSSYAMAALFWLFGTTMATARIGMAVLHAATGVVLYATARRLAVRRELAVVVVLAYLAISQATWPYASWHWFSTCVSALLFLAVIAGPWAPRPRWAVVPGLVNGILIGVQQQKGAVLAAGVCLVFALDAVIDRRYPSPPPWRQLALRLAWFAAGVALVIVPLLAIFVLLAGPEPVYAALVRFPLENYRGKIQSGWGALGPLAQGYAAYTLPAVLRYSPAALALPALWCLANLLRGRERQRVRDLTALVVLSGFSVLSVWYYPDLIHIAFIAAGCWLCAAVGMEWILSAVRPGALARLAGVLVMLAVGAPLVLHLAAYARLLRQQFPVSHETAFGRVDFTARWQPLFVDHVRELLAQSPSGELFCYPSVAAPYLTTGGRNPTPYQFLLASVSPPQQVRDAYSILETRRVPYIVAAPLFLRTKDPISDFIREHYEVVDLPEIAAIGERPGFWLYRRKDLVGDTAAPP